jgi:hypothetical protein
MKETRSIEESTDKIVIQPSDEDAQGNVLTEKELKSKRTSEIHRTPRK